MNGYQIVSEAVQSRDLLADPGHKKFANSLGFEKFKVLETPEFKITQVKVIDQPTKLKIDGKAQDIKKLLLKLKNKERELVSEDDIGYNEWLQQGIDEAIEGIDSNPKYQDPEAKCRVTMVARQ